MLTALRHWVPCPCISKLVLSVHFIVQADISKSRHFARAGEALSPFGPLAALHAAEVVSY